MTAYQAACLRMSARADARALALVTGCKLAAGAVTAFGLLATKVVLVVLAKVLAGLYLPDEGTVSWDGTPTTALNRHEAFGHVSLLSQTFPHWSFTARANLTVGRHTRPETGGVLEDAARRAAASPSTAPTRTSSPPGASTPRCTGCRRASSTAWEPTRSEGLARW